MRTESVAFFTYRQGLTANHFFATESSCSQRSKLALSAPLLLYACTAKNQVPELSPVTTYDATPGFADLDRLRQSARGRAVLDAEARETREVEPSVFWVGGVHDSVALPVVGCVTVIEKAGNEPCRLLSVTAITMIAVHPGGARRRRAREPAGAALKVAHVGLFWMVYVSVSPSASAPVGWNAYACRQLHAGRRRAGDGRSTVRAGCTVIVNGRERGVSRRRR